MLINSPNISGSLTVTGNSVISGSLTVLGSITGAITGSATTASYVEYSNVANKPALVSGSSQISFNGITDKPTLVSGSSQITYSGLTGIPSGIVSGSAQVAAFGYATTGSNTFIGNQIITGSILGSGSLTIDGCITATGQIVAQTINVQQVTSSIVYSCGSNIFGTSLSNTQQFTGSMFITGSNLNANVGSACFQGSVSGATIYGSTAVCGPLVCGGAVCGGTGVFGNTGAGSFSLSIANNDQSNARIRLTNTGTGGSIFSLTAGNPGASNTGLAIFDENCSATRMYFNSAGNVGIGTTSPSARLHIIGGSTTTGIANAATTVTNRIDVANPAITLGFGYVAQDIPMIQSVNNVTNNAISLTINPFGGNVGIGTTSPCSLLSVAGAGGSTRGSNGYLVHIGGIDGCIDPFRYMIGFSHGNTYTADNVRAAVGMMVTSGGAGNLVFETGGSGAGQTERLRITSTGIACFACQVCAAGNLLLGGAGTANTIPQYTAAGVLANSRMTTYGNGCFSVNFGWSVCARIGFDNDNTGTYFYGLELDNGTRRLNIIGKAPDSNSGVGIWTGTTSYEQRLVIGATGIACFACQVCAPSFVGGTVSGTNATISNAGTACTVTDILTLANTQSGPASVCAGAGILFIGNLGGTAARIYSRGNMNFNNGSDLVFQTQASAGALQCTMVINGGSQNVGIGTFTPQSTLHLYTINTPSVVRVESACDQAGLRLIAGVPGTARASRIDFLNGATCVGRPQWTIINDYNQNGTNDLSFVNCDPTTRVVTITQGGNVGIGVTGPTFRLDVQNNTQAIARILDTSTNSSLVLQAGTGSGMKVTGYNYTTSTAVPLYISVDGANTIMQSGGGNVGINTTSPSAKLDVSYTLGSETGVRLVGGAGACCGNMFRSYISEYSDGSPINLFWANHGNPARTNTLVRIHTNETAAGGYPLRITAQGSLCSPTYEALAVNHVGSVTIGTSCAAFGRPLTVSNDIVAYFSNQESITMGLSAGTGQQSWGIQVCDTGDGGSALHLNARGGNVGINKGSGNNAAYPLDVTGIVASSTGFLVNSGAYNSISEVPYTGMYMTAAGSSDGFGALLISSRTDIARPIIFGTSNGSVSTERVRITPGGNVGIGTNCPSVTLDINGGVRFRGDIYTQFEYIASGNFTNGTYYNIVGVNQISTGIYILEGYVDTFAAGGGTYFMRFASVPFYFWDVGSNSTSFVDLPPVLGTGHHLGNPFPLFRLQQTLGGAGIYLQFNPSATWTGIDNSSGKTFQVRLKRIS